MCCAGWCRMYTSGTTVHICAMGIIMTSAHIISPAVDSPPRLHHLAVLTTTSSIHRNMPAHSGARAALRGTIVFNDSQRLTLA
jgi:hypothetical protein